MVAVKLCSEAPKRPPTLMLFPWLVNSVPPLWQLAVLQRESSAGTFMFGSPFLCSAVWHIARQLEELELSNAIMCLEDFPPLLKDVPSPIRPLMSGPVLPSWQP